MSEADPRNLLVKIAKLLDELQIPYLVTGGLAVLIWGQPRFTADIDIVIETKAEDRSRIYEKLLELGKSYIDETEIKKAIEIRGEFNFIDGESGIKVDFWILKDDEFDVSRLKRRVAREVLGENVYFTSPEDLILIKLVWYKESGSSRHVEDVESVIKISGDKLDLRYIKEWAEKLTVSSHWQRVFNSPT